LLPANTTFYSFHNQLRLSLAFNKTVKWLLFWKYIKFTGYYMSSALIFDLYRQILDFFINYFLCQKFSLTKNKIDFSVVHCSQVILCMIKYNCQYYDTYIPEHLLENLQQRVSRKLLRAIIGKQCLWLISVNTTLCRLISKSI
jgi:hypothetical protein